MHLQHKRLQLHSSRLIKSPATTRVAKCLTKCQKVRNVTSFNGEFKAPCEKLYAFYEKKPFFINTFVVHFFEDELKQLCWQFTCTFVTLHAEGKDKLHFNT